MRRLSSQMMTHNLVLYWLKGKGKMEYLNKSYKKEITLLQPTHLHICVTVFWPMFSFDKIVSRIVLVYWWN